MTISCGTAYKNSVGPFAVLVSCGYLTTDGSCDAMPLHSREENNIPYVRREVKCNRVVEPEKSQG